MGLKEFNKYYNKKTSDPKKTHIFGTKTNLKKEEKQKTQESLTFMQGLKFKN